MPVVGQQARALRAHGGANDLDEAVVAAGGQLALQAEGAKDHATRGREKARQMLQNYEPPKMDEGIAEGLRDFIARREEVLPDTVN